jgi:predicted CoA-substrate-specific enzyme activase
LPTSKHTLGVDIGSVALAVVAVGPAGELVQSVYRFHFGRPAEALRQVLSQFDLAQIGRVAATVATPPLVKADRRFDDQVALLTAARRFYPRARSILSIGAEKFGLVQLDDQANYLNFRANTGCAAGTGSFLDQQALRLKLQDAAALGELALRNTGSIPKIASRCAVFAKTDLIHAQQEGYRLEEICDGLCFGLAKNVVDVLFSGQNPLGPVLLAGGVANNAAVARHIQKLIGLELMVSQHHCGAVGAALCLQAEDPGVLMGREVLPEDLIRPEPTEKIVYHPPIALNLSQYPDFNSIQAYQDDHWEPANPVEVDVYEDLQAIDSQPVYLGIDIGSTSSKSVMMTVQGRTLAGFYTRTAGRPVKATQNLLATMNRLLTEKAVDPQICGVATTGSGRKFAGAIVGADLVLDEITAHAKAAVALQPEVDTIIEIGGQDSKFTTLQNGRVTFSIMNAVCAAGTGSFIEEQAQKLGCPLSEIAGRTEGQRSPLASDRCTVFMERDINYYLATGYSVDEVLAAVLHSVIENYLNKVAIETSIGRTVAFQGATARNKSLVAILERRLQKPIFVSRFCHLTGAMGAALALAEKGVRQTRFKGLQLYRHAIPIRSEICDLCTNHCKITVAQVQGEEVAYGFLCGRDYQTRKRVPRQGSAFNLLSTYHKAFHLPQAKPSGHKSQGRDIVIGLPAALHLIEDLPMWQHFFANLGINTITSAVHTNAVKEGKPLTGAEFCAPMTALFGHVQYLLTRCDHIFLPFYLEQKNSDRYMRRQYCYYTQFAPALASGLAQRSTSTPVLTPLVHYLYNDFYVKVQLHRMLKNQLKQNISFLEVNTAYDRALKFKQQARQKLKEAYLYHVQQHQDLHVVLLGRPYTVLIPSMNKGILDIFAGLGVQTFYQQMLSYALDDVHAIAPLLTDVHWHYAAQTLEAAEVTARSESAYPVLVTAFKCTPDSFVIDYFKKVMAAHDKPYAILQLDEHDSSVGYETRIEAAVAAFREHYASGKSTPGSALVPGSHKQQTISLADKTVLFPDWDPTAQRLVVANLQKSGFDARLLESSEGAMRRSMRLNNGQCMPLTIIAQEYMDYIVAHDLDPGRTVLWMSSAQIACNIGLFVRQIQHLLQAHGRGMERAGLYAGNLSLADISMKLPVNTYLAYMFGGLLKKMGCMIRPYERRPGETDRVMDRSLILLEDAFKGSKSKEAALAQVVEWFAAIPQQAPHPTQPRPKVAIFGDLYVRDNELVNQDLIHFIESQGGEVVTTPYSSYVKMIAQPYLRKWFVEGRYLEVLSSKAFIATISQLEKIYYKYFQRILKEPEPVFDVSAQEILAAYQVRIENNGESMENILKIYYLKKYHPEIALFVQTSPAFCCPSLITEAMAATIERITQTPIVSITYDGTGGAKNDVITPYLKFPRHPIPHAAGDILEHCG